MVSGQSLGAMGGWLFCAVKGLLFVALMFLMVLTFIKMKNKQKARFKIYSYVVQ